MRRRASQQLIATNVFTREKFSTRPRKGQRHEYRSYNFISIERDPNQADLFHENSTEIPRPRPEALTYTLVGPRGRYI